MFIPYIKHIESKNDKKVTETMSEVKLQSLYDHTVQIRCNPYHVAMSCKPRRSESMRMA